MPSPVKISVMGLSLATKRLKTYCAYCTLMYFSSLAFETAAEDIAKPPRPGEKTQTSIINQTPPLALPEEPKPESDDSRNIPQTEVNIIHRKDARIEEYRVNGRLRYVKIIPNTGKPYYLVDKDGDGELETRHNDLDGIPPINEWILLEW